MNIFLEISYDGTNYAGWQRQKNVVTIQEQIENAIFDITREKVDVIASGRTDAGVHALGQVANFITKSNIKPENFAKAINTKLPKDIVIKSSREMDENFNSRFSAKKKTYIYQIYNSDTKSPFLDKYSMFINKKLDLELMKNEVQKLAGEHNFTSFYTAEKDNPKNPVRNIYYANVEKKDELIIVTLCGNGFLYNMVRIIAGTLIDIGLHKKEDIKTILEQKNREKAGATAKAKGLFLKSVQY